MKIVIKVPVKASITPKFRDASNPIAPLYV